MVDATPPATSVSPTAATSVYEYEFNDPAIAPLQIHQDPSGALGGGVGATVWDSALVAAKYLEKRLAKRPDEFKGMRAVEVGAGTGILGLAFARIANGLKEMVLTDKTIALPLLEKNVKEVGNGGEIEGVKMTAGTAGTTAGNDSEVRTRTAPLDWTVAAEAEALGQFDIILIADCMAWPELYPPLVDTLERLCGPKSIVIMAYERRNFEAEVDFFAMFGKKFAFRNVPEEEQDDVCKAEDIYLFTGRKR
ncbi:hypothetical protein HK104_009186 [Borealophlyctis nickersoniae]|nr:hypothetical protein HK104_009186 [Borealophlyctis nickersoniae]